MLVCACNAITEQDTRQAITKLLEADGWQMIVPAKVYHHLGKRGRCCDCFGDVYALIVETTAHFHAARSSDQSEIRAIIERLTEFQNTQPKRQT